MTDTTEPGRIDLTALLEPLEPRRVIEAALDRAAASRQSGGAVLAALARPWLAAAAALALLAGALLLSTSRRRDAPDRMLAAWAQSGYVPTNAELLTVFAGYGR